MSTKGEVGSVKLVLALQLFFADRSKAVFLLWTYLLFMFPVYLCLAVLSVRCTPLDSIVCCVFVTFPYGVPAQVWYLIVSIPWYDKIFP